MAESHWSCPYLALASGPNCPIRLLGVLPNRACSASPPVGCHPTAQTNAFKARSSLQPPSPLLRAILVCLLPCVHEDQQGAELGKDVKSCYSICGSLYKRIHFHSPACLLQSKYNAAANNVLCHSRPQPANARAAAVGATSPCTTAVLSPHHSPGGCLHPRSLGTRSSPCCESCLSLNCSSLWALQLQACKPQPCWARLPAGGAALWCLCLLGVRWSRPLRARCSPAEPTASRQASLAPRGPQQQHSVVLLISFCPVDACVYACTHVYWSALEVSGTWCLHLHYSEAVKGTSVCLSLHGHVSGPLGMAVWLEMAGTWRWCLRQSEGGSGGSRAQPMDQTALARTG